MTKDERIEAIVEGFWNLNDTSRFELWHEYCDENNCRGDYIYDNGESFFDEFYDGRVWDAVMSVCNSSKYALNDTYVCFDGYANPVSFNYLDDNDSPIDFEAMAEWMDRTKDTDEINELLEIELEDESEED